MQAINYKIYPLNHDVNRTWFVEYKHPQSGKKLKIYGQLSKCQTMIQKLAEADRIVCRLKADLKKEEEEGPARIDPFPGLDIARLVQYSFEERSIYLNFKSISTYRTKVVVFVKWYRMFGHKPEVVHLGIGLAFVKYLKETGISHTTINAYSKTIKSMFRGFEHLLPANRNPFNNAIKLRERRKSYLFFDEILQTELRDRMIQEDPELWLACQCQYYLLLRPNELRTIRIGAFNIRNATIRVEGDVSKNQETQFITIPDEFIKQLEFVNNYPPHFYLFSKNGKPGLIPHTRKCFPNRHQKMLRRHGLPTRDYKFYSWKITGAVMYYLATGDIKGLKEQGRWHSLDMVNEYLKRLGVLDIDWVRIKFPKIGSHKSKSEPGMSSKELDNN